MNRESYSNIAFRRYVNANTENSRILDYKSIGAETHFYDELKDTVVNGFPFASDFADKDGNALTYEEYCKLSEVEKAKYRLRYHYLPNMHELYIGTTGSGKTTSCLEPQIRAISAQKNKPNIFVSDPKGEIFLHSVKHLKDNGYDIKIINFKDVSRSNCWNPFEEIYLKQMELKDVGKDCVIKTGNDYDKSLDILCDPSEFKNGYHLVYDGVAFPTNDSFQKYVAEIKNNIRSEVSSLVNQITTQMFPEELRGNDPSWSNGAREFFGGMIMALLDEALSSNGRLTKEMFNIKTMNDLYSLVTGFAYADNNNNNEYGPEALFAKNRFDKFLKGKGQEYINKITLVTENAANTRRCYLGVCQSMIGKWINEHIFTLTTKTDIDLDDSKNPIALFIVTRDYDKSDNVVAGLFLNWVYRQFLNKAEKTERKNGLSSSRPMHFMLDEFANIPAIPDFDNKIATARSRNMWFHLYVQSYEQLKTTYDEKVASIIVDNCNQQTFLGSQSIMTKDRFSKECGQTTVRQFAINPSEYGQTCVTLPLLPLSVLNNIEPGAMYIKRIKYDAIKSTFIRSYQCAEAGIFKDFWGVSYRDYVPRNLVNPYDDKHTYAPIQLSSTSSDDEDDCLYSKPKHGPFDIDF